MKLDPRALPSTDDIQRTLFQTLKEKKHYFYGGVGVVVVLVLLVIGYIYVQRSSEREARARIFEATAGRAVEDSIRELEPLVNEVPDDLKAYTLMKLAQACATAGREPARPDDEAIDYLDRGLEALRTIKRDHAEDHWARVASVDDPDITLLRSMMRNMTADRQWRAEHRYVPPVVDTTRTALIETSKGNIKIGFYEEIAPEHVANFIKLAKAGFYNNTLVHGAFGGTWIKMGDPNTRDRENRKSFGKGGPGYALEPEPARYKARHTEGTVSTELVEGQESGSQFNITLTDHSAWDKTQTPFGEVVDGLDVARAISHVQTVARLPDEESAGINSHIPLVKVVVYTVSIWEGDEIAEGHRWDTEIIGKKYEPEPAKDEGAADPEVDAKAEALWAEAMQLEKDGNLEEALVKVREVIGLKPTYPGALEKATELAEKTR